MNHLLGSLLFHVIQKFIGIWISCACEHEILPHHDAEAVAHIEEIIWRIDASAPYPEHIEMSRHAFSLQLDCLIFRHPRLNHLLRNVVGAFDVYLFAVHLEIQGASDAVGLFDEFYLTNSSFNFLSINKFVVFKKYSLNISITFFFFIFLFLFLF